MLLVSDKSSIKFLLESFYMTHKMEITKIHFHSSTKTLPEDFNDTSFPIPIHHLSV